MPKHSNSIRFFALFKDHKNKRILGILLLYHDTIIKCSSLSYNQLYNHCLNIVNNNVDISSFKNRHLAVDDISTLRCYISWEYRHKTLARQLQYLSVSQIHKR